MSEILERIYDLGIVPVIVLEDAAQAVPVAQALVRAGLPVAEVTFRTQAAAEALRRIASEVPELLLGAGTVLTRAQAELAIEAGAQFIVSPGFNPSLTAYVLARGALMIPGTETPREMEQAMELGLRVLKFFPAEQNGGIAKLKAIAPAYTELRWMPTGGINLQNLNDYLGFERIVACGGSWMVKQEWIASSNWQEIEQQARAAVQHMLGFRLSHVGLNHPDSTAAAHTAASLGSLFGFTAQEEASSFFLAQHSIELRKDECFGSKGHLAIETNNLRRALVQLRARGVQFREETHTATAVYLTEEWAGFAIHLLQK